VIVRNPTPVSHPMGDRFLSKSSSGHLKKSANPLNYFALKTQFLTLTFIYKKNTPADSRT
jgi:hypothetical protein